MDQDEATDTTASSGRAGVAAELERAKQRLKAEEMTALKMEAGMTAQRSRIEEAGRHIAAAVSATKTIPESLAQEELKRASECCQREEERMTKMTQSFLTQKVRVQAAKNHVIVATENLGHYTD